MARRGERVEPVPDAATLHDAALRHLARYAATETGLMRVLQRRVARWARAAVPPVEPEQLATLRAAARDVARQLAAAGAVDDAAFAAARAARLARSGRSRRAISAHLAAKGVAEPQRAAVATDAAGELAAAVTTLRRRRIGPFGPAADPEARRRQLAVLARAGFAQDVARRALALPLDEAEELLQARRR